MRQVNLSSNILRDVQEVTGSSKLPFFDNVPYLRRFRVKGEIFITTFVTFAHSV